VSPDGALAAAGYEEGLRVFDLLSGRQVSFQPIRDCRSAWFTHDGLGLVTCGASGLAHWPLAQAGEAGRQEIRLGAPRSFHDGPLSYASITPDDRWLAAADRETGCAKVYDLRDPSNHFELCSQPHMQFVAISPDGKWVATSTWGGRGVRIWDLATRRQAAELPVDGSAVVGFSPDSHLLATGARGHTVLECGSWRVLYQSSGSDPLLSPCAFSPDSRMVALLKAPHIIELREAISGRVLTSLEAPGSSPISGLRFTPDATRLLALEWTRQIQVWNLASVHQELAKIGLDFETPPKVGVGPGELTSKMGDLESGTHRQSAGNTDAGQGIFASHLGIWFYALPLGALAVGVAVGLYTLRYHQRMIHSYEEVESIAVERHRALSLAQAELVHSEKMRALGTLAAGIAHDFNNLLSIIRMGNNFLLRRGVSAEDKAESGLAVERAVDQGKRIVRSMLGYSREPSEEEESYSVADLVNEAGLLLNQQFLSGITLTLELNRELPQVQGRRGRLQQILLNLMVNATEAMNGQGRLRIAARTTDSATGTFVLRPGQAPTYIELVIEDTGPGIEPRIQERVFEPFFSTKPRGASSGTGLGLSLVHSLAEQEKIGISLQSAPGRGTSFTLWIPVAEADTESPRTRPAAVSGEVSVGSAGP
jgi:signal transduction histidine kinase